ncbi:MAG: hypothetical protein JNL30_12345 [Rubrivivax sp.]|nr:hypothetical protein [Rubrivivax sp.]
MTSADSTPSASPAAAGGARSAPTASAPSRARGWCALATAIVAGAAPLAAVLAQGGTPGAATAGIAAAAALLCGALAAWAGHRAAGQPPAARTRPRAASTLAPTTGAMAAFDNRGGGDLRTGPALMASAVVPVWQRQLEASRTMAEQGVSGLLETFNAMSDGLAVAAQAAASSQSQLGAGSTDELLERNQSLIDELLQPVASLRAGRDETQRELGQLAELMQAFQHAAKELDSLARHARLVAMNAAIEANRAGAGHTGFGAVAREVLDLSGRTGTSAERLLQRFSEAQRKLDGLRRRHELDTGNDETTQLELRQRARQLIGALAGDLGQAMTGSRELREAGAGLQKAMEEVFMGFQFQDRFAQMMGNTTGDMQRFVEWLATGGNASHADAVAWLARLNGSYTMEEQRSHHHGTVQIAHSPAVEFF